MKLIEDMTQEELAGAIVASGGSWRDVVDALTVSESTARRLLRERSVETHDCASALGRRAVADAVLTAGDVENLRVLATRINRGASAGSVSLALRIYAQTTQASESFCEWFASWQESGASKHAIPRSVREALHVPKAVIEASRSQTRAIANWLPHTVGTLRRNLETGERLRAGEVESWDDLTVNFAFCVPFAGAPYGVQVGRFQLLGGVDSATGKFTGASFVVRERESYRGVDIVRTMAGAWGVNGMPQTVYLERGIWESLLVQEFLAALGIKVLRAYRARQKLVEGAWNKLHSVLSLLPGQVGRYQGEEEDMKSLLVSAKKGSLDPKKHFVSLEDGYAGVMRAIDFVDRDPIESRHYGRWVPIERYAEDIAERPLRALPQAIARSYFAERKEWTVKKGMVGGSVMHGGLGFSLPVSWTHRELYKHEGKKVAVLFDLCEQPITARIVEPNTGALICDGATCLSAVPYLRREESGSWCVHTDMGSLGRSRTACKEVAHTVMAEAREIKKQFPRVDVIRDVIGNPSRMPMTGEVEDGEYEDAQSCVSTNLGREDAQSCVSTNLGREDAQSCVSTNFKRLVGFEDLFN